MKTGDDDLSPSQRTVVLRELKRSGGLSVNELAARLGMSYMGVKQHCLNLQKLGHLTSRNQHRGPGRPHLLYRLNRRGQQLFFRQDNGLLISVLKQAGVLFGANAAAKLLYLSFQEKAAGYSEKIPSARPLEARLARLAALRDADGCMARAEGGNCIVEYHCPWRDLYEAFPEAPAMEEALFSKVLGEPVVRRVIEAGDHYEIRFETIPSGAASPNPTTGQAPAG